MGKLHEAARNSHEPKDVVSLVEGGANVDEKDNLHASPLHYAARHGNSVILKALLQANAKIDIVNNKDQTPLYQAVVGEHGDVVQILLDNNADANIQTKQGYTALHFAARNGLQGIIKQLLQNKADVHVKTDEDQTARDLAIKYENKSIANIIDKFIETGSCEVSNKSSYLDDAKNAEDEEILRELAELEVQPDVRRVQPVAEIQPLNGNNRNNHARKKQDSPPKVSVAPKANDSKDGFGKVYVGAPAPHLMQRKSSPCDSGSCGHNH
eukprot:m.38733 g.38733  ORF g.38733 m.38733 type:complete len:268 (+) comp9467_c0_seq2:1325-2128(+)